MEEDPRMIGGGQTDPDGSFDAAVYLDVLRVEGTDVVGLATVHGLNAPVPNCPGWTIGCNALTAPS